MAAISAIGPKELNKTYTHEEKAWLQDSKYQLRHAKTQSTYRIQLIRRPKHITITAYINCSSVVIDWLVH